MLMSMPRLYPYHYSSPKRFLEVLSGTEPERFRDAVTELPDDLFADETFFSPSRGAVVVSMTVGGKKTFPGSYGERICELMRKAVN